MDNQNRLGFKASPSNESIMRVEIHNKTKHLHLQVAVGISSSSARHMVDEMSVREINQLAHYSVGDEVEVTVKGGNPPVVIYRRRL